MLPGAIPGAWHCRQRAVSRTHSLLFSLSLHLSFPVPDLVLVPKLLEMWTGKLVWGWELWTKQVLTGSWMFALEQPAVICLGLCVLSVQTITLALLPFVGWPTAWSVAQLLHWIGSGIAGVKSWSMRGSFGRRTLLRQPGRGSFPGIGLERDFYQQNFQVTQMKSKYLRYNPLFLFSLPVV